MKKVNAALVFLISSLAITGLSFVDGKIWDIIFLIVGMLAYSIVGIFFSIGLLHGREAGKEAYAFVFFLLVIVGYGVYQGLEKLRLWILSWPIVVKITIPIVIVLSIVGLIILIVIRRKRNNAD